MFMYLCNISKSFNLVCYVSENKTCKVRKACEHISATSNGPLVATASSLPYINLHTAR